jgi:3'(2'), 5'-bisphosphate nucleotidase
MKNITYHKSVITQDRRAELMGQHGCVLWFTGLSGSGKSTVACETEKMLYAAGIKTFILDGDNLRFGLNSDLGFSEEDRNENIRRIAETASLMARAGLTVLVSAISPKENQRENARKIISPYAAFVEIYVDAPLDVCAKRDPKGLYKKAAAGEIKEFTGVSSPYEAPEYPDILLKTDEMTVEECAKKVFAYHDFLQNADHVTEVMVNTAVEAGKRILEIYNTGFSVEYKSDSSPLTDADKAADRYINETLAKEFPDFARLSEETADNKKRLENDCCFIIDPLDGTKEFVSRNGEFTVNIGLAHCGRAIGGAVYIPVTGEIYYAFNGRGAFAGKADGSVKIFDPETRISVSDKTEKLTFLCSRSFLDEKTKAIAEKYKDRIEKTVQCGSSIKGCFIAEGKADCYYRFANSYEWDTCAMQAVAECAGGVFLQCDLSPMRYNRKDTLNAKGFLIVNRKENIWTI